MAGERQPLPPPVSRLLDDLHTPGHWYDTKSYSVASRTHAAASLAFYNFKILSKHICSSHVGIYI